MAEQIRRTLVLTGGRKGKTCDLMKVHFTDGKTVVEGTEEQLDKLCSYLGRSYQAFPVGSEELKHHLGEAEYGKLHLQETGGSGGAASVRGGARPDGEGSPEGTANNGGGAGGAEAGATGGVPGGGGHADTGVDGRTGQRAKILAAVKGLRHEDDESWTADGRPRIDAVEALSGITGLTRARVEEAAPGVVRKRD